MYGFAYGILDTNHVLVKMFNEEELVEVYGSETQIDDIRLSLEERDMELKQEPIIIAFNEELELEEEGVFYGTLAG